MENKLTKVIIGIVLVAFVGGLVFWQKNQKTAVSEQPQPVVETTQSQTTTTTTTTTTTPASVASGITSATVALHNSRTSCWSTINGNVYDLTSWIPEHPGGEQAILQLCGTDGSAKYNGQHGGAPKQAAILSGFKIGVATK